MHRPHHEHVCRRSILRRIARAAVGSGPVLLVAGALLLAPTSALAAPPVLRSPDANASVTEGGTLNFEWTGDLQGHADARDRAYFVVEVIAASKVPPGQQAAWPEADSATPTTAGQATTSLQLGAPPAGSWRWRVCAWGVVNPVIDNALVQLPDGCSAARTFTSAAATVAPKEITVVDQERKVVVRREPTVITRAQPVEPSDEAVDETPAPDAPVDAEPAVEPAAPAPVKIQPRDEAATTQESSALDLGGDELELLSATDSASARSRDVASNILNGLSASIPGVPIPFWTLAFLLAALPIAVSWRRNALAMFDWSDGSIDGFGTPPTEYALASAQPAAVIQVSSDTADGAASETSNIEATTPAKVA